MAKTQLGNRQLSAAPFTLANLLANGGFENWGYGNSFSTPGSGTNIADAWAMQYTGSPTFVISKDTTFPESSKAAAKLLVSSITASSQMYLQQAIANPTVFVNTLLSVSFRIANTVASAVRISIQDSVGTSYSGYVPSTAQPDSWTNLTGSRLSYSGSPYYNNIALNTGDVLVSAGSTCYLFKSNNTFVQTGTMVNSRGANFGMVKLANGKVLAYGGNNSPGTSEVYDPATETWTNSGALVTGRYLMAGVLLNNGKVLIAGGSNGSDLASAELYDPVGGTWTATGSMNQTRQQSVEMVVLQSGDVLVAAGYTNPLFSLQSEVYSVSGGTWTNTTGLMTYAHLNSCMILLTTGPSAGKVLIVAGQQSGGTTNQCSLYNPATQTWAFTASLNGSNRVCNSSGSTGCGGTYLARLTNGNIFTAGGYDPFGGAPASTTEVFNPTTLTWTSSASGTPNDSTSAKAPSLVALSTDAPLIRQGVTDYILLLGQNAQPGSLEMWIPAGTGYTTVTASRIISPSASFINVNVGMLQNGDQKAGTYWFDSGMMTIGEVPTFVPQTPKVGGVNGDLLWNNNGKLDGALGVTTDGTNLTVTGTINTDNINGGSSPLNIVTGGGNLNTSNLNINPGGVISGIFTAGDLNLAGGGGVGGGFGSSLTLKGWIGFPYGPSHATLQTGTNGDFIIRTTAGNSPSELARFTAGGKVGIKTAAPTVTLAMAGSVSTGTLTVVNFAALSGASFTIGGLNPVTYGASHTLTEGSDWTAATSNIATASTIVSAINGAGFGVTASNVGGTSAVVTIISNEQGDHTQYTLSSSSPANLSTSGATLTGGYGDVILPGAMTAGTSIKLAGISQTSPVIQFQLDAVNGYDGQIVSTDLLGNQMATLDFNGSGIVISLVNSTLNFGRLDVYRDGSVDIQPITTTQRDTTLESGPNTGSFICNSDIGQFETFKETVGPYGVWQTLDSTSIATATAAYTIGGLNAGNQSWQSIVQANATGGAFTVTLPTAATSTNLRYTVKKIDSSANAVTIQGNGAETIDGSNTQTLAAQWQALTMVSNGTSWIVI